MKPALLFLAHRIPFPPTKGEKLRAFNLLKGLAQHYRITLAAPIDDAEDWQHREALGEWCETMHFADIRGRTRHRAAFRALASGEPVTYAFFRESGMMAWVHRHACTDAFDAVFVYSSGAAPYLRALEGTPSASAPLILDFVDADSEKWVALADTAKGPMRAIYRREARLLRAEEARLAARAAASLLVTGAEAQLFRDLTGVSTGVTVIGNGVDTEYWGASRTLASPYAGDRPRLIFTGVMDYEPNVDAVLWFAEHVMPLLRKRDPAPEFVIAGGRPAAAVQALAQQPDIRVTGRVEDMRSWLGHASLAVTPLRIARGIQNKVLEAMAAGTPVVTSSPALTGIEAEPGIEVALADDAPAFARAIGALLDDPGRAERQAAAAQALVRRAYGWQARTDALAALIDTARHAAEERVA